MYIEPNSNIVLLKGIRLDNSYDHTIYFANKQAQYNYFYSKKKVEFTQNYYQRVERGYFKADINAEQLYDVSYMMFRNTAFGDRWFYAFGTSAEYVNNRVTRIGFELDVMQTWMFDYSLLESWVEREHIDHDTFGNNIVPENLNIGDYMVASRNNGYSGNTELTLTPCVVVATTYDLIRQGDGTFSFTDGQAVDGKMWGKIYSGCRYKFFKLRYNTEGGVTTWYLLNNDTIKDPISGQPEVPSSPDLPSQYRNYMELNDWLALMTEKNKITSIVSVFMFYEEFENLYEENRINPIKLTCPNNLNHNFAFGSYQPRNTKLYTFPYNVLSVTDNRGTMATYKMEYWRGQTPEFNLYAGLSCDPSMMIVPLNYNYKDVPGINEENYDEKMVAKGFPPCSYNIDSFTAYIAQNGGVLGMGATLGLQTLETMTGLIAPSLALEGAKDNLADANLKLSNALQPDILIDKVISARAGVKSAESGVAKAKGQMFAASAKASKNIAMSVKDLYIASTKPPQFGGNANGDVIFSSGQQKFSFEIKHIRPEFARIIDNYFDMYGYATKTIKVPNTHSRPHWNYVQTERCTIETDLNIEDTASITAIYDKGITFWKNGDEIGDYSLDNRAW